MADDKIMVFALSTCSHCKSARKFLTEQGVEYQAFEVDLLTGEERSRVVQNLIKYNPERSFPTIVINDGEKVVVGFREEKLKEALNLK